MRASLTRTSLAVGSILLAVLLTGCGGSSTITPGPSAGTPTPTLQPSASASAAPKDVLFTIAANVRGKDGSTIAILLTAHKPLTYSDRDAKPLVNEFVAACGAGLGGRPLTADTLAANGSILLSIDLTSSVNGKPFIYPLDVTFGSPYYGQSARGKGITPADPTQPCYRGYKWRTSGSGHAVADFESGNPGPDVTLWRSALYGFSVPFDSGATIEACKVTLTDLAKAGDLASTPGWDPTVAGTGISCEIGQAPTD